METPRWVLSRPKQSASMSIPCRAPSPSMLTPCPATATATSHQRLFVPLLELCIKRIINTHSLASDFFAQTMAVRCIRVIAHSSLSFRLFSPALGYLVGIYQISPLSFNRPSGCFLFGGVINNTGVCVFSGRVHLILLSIDLGMDLLVGLFIFSRQLTGGFPKQLNQLVRLLVPHDGPLSSLSYKHSALSIFFILTILVDV